MDYLFFDLECSDGINICSFGYVLCDENLAIIESKDIIINPRARFFTSKMREKVGFDLAYTEEQFKREPDFKHYYEFIKGMLTAPNRTVVGHAARNDAGFIRNACEKYNLEYITYNYADTQLMFKTYAREKGIEGYDGINIGLDDLSILLGLGEFDNMHRSDADAMATYRCFKQMALDFGMSPQEFIKKCGYCTGGLRGGEVVIDMPAKMLADEDFGDEKMTNKNRNIIRRFISRYHPDETVDKIYKDKEIAFSRFFENGRAKDMVKLTAFILDRGGKICYDLKLCDIFVTATRKGKFCSRYNYARKIENETGKKIKYITVEKFLSSLGIKSVEELSALPLPNIDLNGPKYKPKKVVEKKKKTHRKKKPKIKQ
ncbi:MAG: 3'-5' exonuclease [Clostridia bacterium]|nr:3'-5' exonuclease [Clostridia bacterium]